MFQVDFQKMDPEMAEAIEKELDRQQHGIELIASENYASKEVMALQGSVLTNKYAEGYPGKRYYGGCEFVDIAENLAIERAKKLFHCQYVNVQPHSGSQANQAVFLSLLHPGDTILGMDLNAGGHLTHGSPVNLSGKWFNSVSYGVSKDENLINYEEVEALAIKHNPKLIIAGGSAYPRIIDFARFRAIADKVEAYFMVDMAHFSGLVAAGVHPNPLPFCDVATTTTHKVLRGPRGGMILANSESIGKKINSAVFPGMQGGPLMHVIAAKAQALKEAMDDSYKTYGKDVVENAEILCTTLTKRGYRIVTGGTDTHLLLIDLRPQGITGKQAEASLDKAGLTCNKNTIPFDPQGPFTTSGIRLGSAAATTRGFKSDEFRTIGSLIADVLDGLSSNPDNNSTAEQTALNTVHELCKKFPIYSSL